MRIFLFLLLSTCFAQAEISGLPKDFLANFDLTENGTIRQRDSSKTSDKFKVERSGDSTRVFSKSSGTTAWHVGSNPCPQNKQLTCLSVYNRDSSRIIGNQHNPFADEDHKGTYSLFKFDKTSGVLQSAIKCKSKFTVSTVRDSGNLKNCFEYTQASCKTWNTYLENESGLTGAEVDIAKQCIDIFKKIDKTRIKAAQLFQSKLADSQKDIESQFDDATKSDGSLRMIADVKITTEPVSPSILHFQSLIDHTTSCGEYETLFEKNRSAQSEYLRRIFQQTPASTTPADSQQRRRTGAAQN